MSDYPCHNDDPIRNAMQQSVAKFITRYMEGKMAFLDKIIGEIQNSTDPAKLKNLRTELNDVLINSDDIKQLEVKAGEIMETMKRLSLVYLEFDKVMCPNSHHDHRSHGHDDGHGHGHSESHH